jgi:hypothetical protein
VASETRPFSSVRRGRCTAMCVPRHPRVAASDESARPISCWCTADRPATRAASPMRRRCSSRVAASEPGGELRARSRIRPRVPGASADNGASSTWRTSRRPPSGLAATGAADGAPGDQGRIDGWTVLAALARTTCSARASPATASATACALAADTPSRARSRRTHGPLPEAEDSTSSARLTHIDGFRGRAAAAGRW